MMKHTHLLSVLAVFGFVTNSLSDLVTSNVNGWEYQVDGFTFYSVIDQFPNEKYKITAQVIPKEYLDIWFPVFVGEDGALLEVSGIHALPVLEFDKYTNGNGEVVYYIYKEICQTFSKSFQIKAGNTICGNAMFETYDFSGYMDYSEIVVSYAGTGETLWKKKIDDVTNGRIDGRIQGGTRCWTDVESWRYKALMTGEYTLSIINYTDDHFRSSVFVSGISVPEPSYSVMMVICFITMGAVLNFKRISGFS